VFPEDRQRFVKYQEKHKNSVFIAKPHGGAQGDDIFLFNDLRQLPQYKNQELVVQRYIDNPFLLKGYKFDLRVYVIISGINEGEVQAFIADEGLARFCTEEYQKPTKDNFKKAFMHLTNYSLNKLSEDF